MKIDPRGTHLLHVLGTDAIRSDNRSIRLDSRGAAGEVVDPIGWTKFWLSSNGGAANHEVAEGQDALRV